MPLFSKHLVWSLPSPNGFSLTQLPYGWGYQAQFPYPRQNGSVQLFWSSPTALREAPQFSRSIERLLFLYRRGDSWFYSACNSSPSLISPEHPLAGESLRGICEKNAGWFDYRWPCAGAAPIHMWHARHVFPFHRRCRAIPLLGRAALCIPDEECSSLMYELCSSVFICWVSLQELLTNSVSTDFPRLPSIDWVLYCAQL